MPSLAALTLLASIALPLASAGSHWSHPRHIDILQRSNSAARTLPRTPRRLGRRDEQATVKCLTDKTFALCAGDDCTDMGSVAAGTVCKDGAITWDTSDEASTEDSSAASASTSVEELVSSSSPIPSSKISAPVVESVTATQKLANNFAKTSTSSAVPASKTSSVASSPSNPATQSSSSDEDDDDWECDAEDEAESSSSSTQAAQTSQAWSASVRSSSQTTAKPSSTSASWSSSSTTSSSAAAVTPDAARVQLIAGQGKHTTTKTTPAWSSSTTTTTSAAAQTTSASSSLGGDSSLTSWITGGLATFFYQGGAYGACGKIHADSDKIVALAIARYGSGSNNAPDCGRQVEIKNDATGATTIAVVADACPGCANYNSLDLSQGAFDAIADEAQGVVPISWKFIS
ncbi:hypothetical protein JCM11641_003430 [Rhodosporidiobolus odoratus]